MLKSTVLNATHVITASLLGSTEAFWGATIVGGGSAGERQNDGNIIPYKDFSNVINSGMNYMSCIVYMLFFCQYRLHRECKRLRVCSMVYLTNGKV